jgi:RHS repeat-associated protein
MTDKATGSTVEPDKYSYGQDVHSSVSQLIDDAGKVKASYGYDAYGGADAPATDSQALTTGDTSKLNPINPYRYSGKRIDTGTASTASTATTASPIPNGSGGYDMGARRYGPDTGSFLQQDMYHGALANLGLALDPLTQNRYALAGGNPISYIETDGHMVTADGGGGSSTPSPSTSPSPSPDDTEDPPTAGENDPGPTVDWGQAGDTLKSALTHGSTRTWAGSPPGWASRVRPTRKAGSSTKIGRPTRRPSSWPSRRTQVPRRP